MADLLATYLQDHHAGSQAGVAVARRLASSGEDDVAQGGRRLALELEAEVRVLEDAMRRLGVRPSRSKDTAASIGERLSRLKLNGHFVTRSPLSTVVELEGLLMGVTGKRELWRTLAHLGETDDRLAGLDFEALDALAVDQRSRLERLRRQSDHVFEPAPELAQPVGAGS